MYTRKDVENYQNQRLGRQEVNEAYNDYVQKYRKEQEYDFYREHKADPWFVERYHPVENFKIKSNQIKLSKYLAA